MAKRFLQALASSLILSMFAFGSSLSAAPAPQAAAQAKTMTIDLSPAGDTLPGVLLKESLTAEQQQAIAAVLDRHQPEMAGVTVGRLATPSDSPQADLSASKAALDQLKTVQAQIESEIATILSPTQLVLHKKALAGGGPALALGEAGKSAPTDGEGSPNYSTSTCYVAAQYGSLARWYAYYAYYYGYYNYINHTSETNAYYDYYYSYYGQYYANYATQQLGAAYFDLYEWSTDFNGYGYNGAGNAYSAYYNAYYGSYYAYQSYLQNSSNNAYYSYYYGYYAYNYAYRAYTNGVYCY